MLPAELRSVGDAASEIGHRLPGLVSGRSQFHCCCCCRTCTARTAILPEANREEGGSEQKAESQISAQPRSTFSPFGRPGSPDRLLLANRRACHAGTNHAYHHGKIRRAG